MHNTWWRGGARDHAALRWRYHHLPQANQDDEATPGLHQGVEDDGVSMGLPARSPLASFVVATLGDETDDVYFVKLESRRRGARADAAVVPRWIMARGSPRRRQYQLHQAGIMEDEGMEAREDAAVVWRWMAPWSSPR